MNYDELNNGFTGLMARKADLVGQQADADTPAKAAQDKLNAFVKEKLPGSQRGGVAKPAQRDVHIQDRHAADQCESAGHGD